MNNCPHCKAQLQEGAKFCPHCMTQLAGKQKIEAPKRRFKKKKGIIISIISIVLVIAIIGGIGLSVNSKKHEPICSYAQFLVAASAVSDRMKIDNLWEIGSFTDTHHFKKQKITQYNAKTNLKDSTLSLFFYNEGEEVYAYFSDVKPQDFYSAESILKCISQAISNYYFTDIDDVFDNESVYPKKTLDQPFDSFFTDLLVRTEDYNSFIDGSGTITTKYIPMTNDKVIIVYYVVERKDANSTIYDLAIDIERQ